MTTSESLVLREYQREGIDRIREHFARGQKRVLLHLATGGGKTLLFSVMLKRVHEKGKKALLVVRGRALVDQASQRLFRESVPHGVVMAGHWNYRPMERIQVCSIDTIHRRGVNLEADMIVIDEAHMAASLSYRKLIDKYPQAYFLSVTATPYVKAGLRHLADHVVYPISIDRLMADGYLVRPRYFSFPTDVNLEGVDIDKKTGDYNQVQLGEAVNKSATLCGDIVKHWLSHARDRPTIAFAVNIRHSRSIVQRFHAAGILAEHIDKDTPEEDRRSAIEALKTGQLKILSNVGILGTGVDIPEVCCLILARPTQSKNLYIQQCGRGTRLAKGKDNFIVLDHASNLVKHGPIEDEEPCDLDGHGKLPKPRTTMVRCPKCFCVFDKKEFGPRCPGVVINEEGEDVACDFVFGVNIIDDRLEEKGSGIVSDNNKILVEITNTKEFFSSRLQKDLDRLIAIAIERNYKPSWVWYKIKDIHGISKANSCRGEVQRRLGLFDELRAKSDLIAATFEKVKGGLHRSSQPNGKSRASRLES